MLNQNEDKYLDLQIGGAGAKRGGSKLVSKPVSTTTPKAPLVRKLGNGSIKDFLSTLPPSTSIKNLSDYTKEELITDFKSATNSVACGSAANSVHDLAERVDDSVRVDKSFLFDKSLGETLTDSISKLDHFSFDHTLLVKQKNQMELDLGADDLKYSSMMSLAVKRMLRADIRHSREFLESLCVEDKVFKKELVKMKTAGKINHQDSILLENLKTFCETELNGNNVNKGNGHKFYKSVKEYVTKGESTLLPSEKSISLDTKYLKKSLGVLLKLGKQFIPPHVMEQYNSTSELYLKFLDRLKKGKEKSDATTMCWLEEGGRISSTRKFNQNDEVELLDEYFQISGKRKDDFFDLCSMYHFLRDTLTLAHSVIKKKSVSSSSSLSSSSSSSLSSSKFKKESWYDDIFDTDKNLFKDIDTMKSSLASSSSSSSSSSSISMSVGSSMSSSMSDLLMSDDGNQKIKFMFSRFPTQIDQLKDYLSSSSSLHSSSALSSSSTSDKYIIDRIIDFINSADDNDLDALDKIKKIHPLIYAETTFPGKECSYTLLQLVLSKVIALDRSHEDSTNVGSFTNGLHNVKTKNKDKSDKILDKSAYELFIQYCSVKCGNGRIISSSKHKRVFACVSIDCSDDKREDFETLDEDKCDELIDAMKVDPNILMMSGSKFSVSQASKATLLPIYYLSFVALCNYNGIKYNDTHPQCAELMEDMCDVLGKIFQKDEMEEIIQKTMDECWSEADNRHIPTSTIIGSLFELVKIKTGGDLLFVQKKKKVKSHNASISNDAQVIVQIITGGDKVGTWIDHDSGEYMIYCGGTDTSLFDQGSMKAIEGDLCTGPPLKKAKTEELGNLSQPTADMKKYYKYKYKYLKAIGANPNILENYKNKLLNINNNIKNINENDLQKYTNKYHKYKQKYLNLTNKLN
jgi:hypothetical protein